MGHDQVRQDIGRTPGALLLIVLFLGSAAFAEDISASKYPLYPDYCRQVSRFFPGKKYRG